MYAIVKTGGKQYKVAENDVIDVEKIAAQAGETVTLSEVLLVAGDGEPKVGAPLVQGASVTAEVVDQFKGDKVLIFKKKRRHNYRRKKGHRQQLTKLRVTGITAG